MAVRIAIFCGSGKSCTMPSRAVVNTFFSFTLSRPTSAFFHSRAAVARISHFLNTLAAIGTFFLGCFDIACLFKTFVMVTHMGHTPLSASVRTEQFLWYTMFPLLSAAFVEPLISLWCIHGRTACCAQFARSLLRLSVSASARRQATSAVVFRCLKQRTSGSFLSQRFSGWRRRLHTFRRTSGSSSKADILQFRGSLSDTPFSIMLARSVLSKLPECCCCCFSEGD